MYVDSGKKDFIFGALIGGAVAVLTSLLFTTKKGKQIQDKIVDTFQDLKEGASDKLSEAKDKAEEGADNLHKKTAQKIKE